MSSSAYNTMQLGGMIDLTALTIRIGLHKAKNVAATIK